MNELGHRSVGLRLACAATLVLLTVGACGEDKVPAAPTRNPGAGGTGGLGAGGTGGLGAGGTGGMVLVSALALEEYVGPEIWTGLKQTITVDSNDVVYVTDGVQIYAVADGAPSVHVSRAEIAQVVDEQFIDIESIDVGPDDRLYIFNEGRPAEILVSAAAGDISVHLTDVHLGVGTPLLIGVESADRILTIVSQGLAAVTADGGTMLYTEEQIQGGTNCGSEDFVVDGSVFYYLPGCTGNDMISGSTDGSAAGIFVAKDALQGYFELLGSRDTVVWQLAGIGKHPAGGLILNFSRSLVRVNADGSFVHIETEPPIYDAGRDPSDDMRFSNGPLAVGSRGQVYLMNSNRTKVYRAEEQAPAN